MTSDPRRDQLAALLKLGRVIPVITIVRVEDAVPLARALVEGGIRLLDGVGVLGSGARGRR